MRQRRFDLLPPAESVRDPGVNGYSGAEYLVREHAGGRSCLSLIRSTPIDRRAQVVAIFHPAPGEDGQEAMDRAPAFAFAAEVAIGHYMRLLVQEYKVHPMQIAWMEVDSSGAIDWLRPSFAGSQLTALRWSPFIMPPYAPRSRQALMSLYPVTSGLFGGRSLVGSPAPGRHPGIRLPSNAALKASAQILGNPT